MFSHWILDPMRAPLQFIIILEDMMYVGEAFLFDVTILILSEKPYEIEWNPHYTWERMESLLIEKQDNLYKPEWKIYEFRALFYWLALKLILKSYRDWFIHIVRVERISQFDIRRRHKSLYDHILPSNRLNLQPIFQ